MRRPEDPRPHDLQCSARHYSISRPLNHSIERSLQLSTLSMDDADGAIEERGKRYFNPRVVPIASSPDFLLVIPSVDRLKRVGC